MPPPPTPTPAALLLIGAELDGLVVLLLMLLLVLLAFVTLLELLEFTPELVLIAFALFPNEKTGNKALILLLIGLNRYKESPPPDDEDRILRIRGLLLEKNALPVLLVVVLRSEVLL